MPESHQTVIRKHLTIPLILFFILTIGNYSFFRYTIDGTAKSSLLSALAQARLLLPLWPIAYATTNYYRMSLRIVQYNLDVFLMLFFWWLSAAFSLNAESYLLYSLWTGITLIGILFTLSMGALTTVSQTAYFNLQLNTIWKGNIVIFFLAIGSFLIKQPGSGIYTLLYSSNSFWAYPVLIIGILSGIRLRWPKKHTSIKLINLIILLSCFAAIYLSARRSPLIVLSLCILLIYFPTKFLHILVVFTLMGWIVSQNKPEILVKNLPDSFMKYRLTRLLGHVRTQKETSYFTRERIWKTYMQEFYDNPLWGSGLPGKPSDEHNDDLSVHFSPHNTFIGMLSEKGLAGTGLFVLVIGKSLLLLRHIKTSKLRKIYLALFLPTLAINWVEYNLLPGQIFFLYSTMVWLLPRGLPLVQNPNENSL